MDELYGDVINHQKVRGVFTEVFYDYHITEQEKSVALLDNMNDKIVLYLVCKRTEGLSDITIKHYALHLKKFSEYMRKNVEDVTSMDIRMHLTDYAKKGNKESTIAVRTDIIRAFFNWLEKEGQIDQNPMLHIKTIKIPERQRRALSRKDFEILRGGAITLRERCLLELFNATGCRLSEVANIKIADLNHDLSRCVVVGKGDKERTVFISEEAQVHIRNYLDFRKTRDNCKYLLATERKPYRQMSNSAIYREVKIIAERSGLDKNVYCHLLRSGFASNLNARGVDLLTLQVLMGHQDVSTTRGYITINDRSIENEYQKYA